MERELWKKTYDTKKIKPRLKRTRGGSFTNPGGHYEDYMVSYFPTHIEFSHEGQRKKFEQLLSRKIVSNKYVSTSSLRAIGLLDEVQMYLFRMGWEAFILLQYLTYVKPTCEFLSSFYFDEQSLMMTFWLGNEEHSMDLFELNDVFHFPVDQDAMVEYDRHAFWNELTGRRKNLEFNRRLSVIYIGWWHIHCSLGRMVIL